jgi:uncharacterized protein YqeY
MTTLLEVLKADRETARIKKNPIVTGILTVLYSDAVNVGKNQGNRLSTDDEVIAVIKKFIKGTEQNIEIYEKSTATDEKEKSKHAEALDIAKQELAILVAYIPKAPTLEVVKESIIKIMNDKVLKKDNSSMGVIMKELKVQYGSALDGASTSKLIKEILAN